MWVSFLLIFWILGVQNRADYGSLSSMDQKPIVVGIGELLWDIFPDVRRLGGAPVNFAAHCAQLGARACPVSAVGEDDLGREILRELDDLAVDAAYVANDPLHPTGTVEVELDSKGKPTYQIREDVAWDYIPTTDQTAELAAMADAVCFGSLAQRYPVSRASIDTFLSAMKPDALRIFDINLRQEFYSKAVVENSLDACNILKLSDEELPVVAEMFAVEGSVEDRLAAIRDRFGLRLIAYTRGDRGSMLVDADEVSDHAGYRGEVVDTVGAGDSFTAALCMGMLRGDSLDSINEKANRLASYVCSQSGAAPVLPDQLRSALRIS